MRVKVLCPDFERQPFLASSPSLMRYRFLPPLFLLAASLAAAQTDPKVALAHEVIQAMHADKVFDGMSAQIQQMMTQMLPSADTPEEQAHVKAVEGKVMALTMDAVKKMLGHMDQIYAEVYTVDELKAMKAFYTSPMGEAAVDKQPQVMRKMTPLVIQMQRELMPKIRAIVEQEKAAAGGGTVPN